MMKLIQVVALLGTTLEASFAAAQDSPRVATVLPPELAESLAREVALELKAANFPALESRFDETLRAALPEAKLRSFWLAALGDGGPLQACAEPRSFLVKEYTLEFMTCKFERKRAELKLTFRSDGRLAGLFLEPEAVARPPWTAPAYVRPESFRESDVKVAPGRKPLPGTLTIPLGEGPFPGVVLVHGSGPQDRDESTGGVRPFQDLAQGLASRGIVVLRYEKRTRVYGKEMAAGEITVKDEVLDDALAGLRLLRETPGVDSRRLFVAGHSLGALLAPRIAALYDAVSRDSGRVRGVVMLASPSRPMSEVVRDQAAWLAGPGASVAQQLQALDVRREADALADLYAARSDSKGGAILGASRSYWLDIRNQHAVDAARSFGRPILVLQGERDYQVPMSDFLGWKKALAGRRNVTFRSYAKLDHLFVAGEGRSSPEDYEKPGHVAADVVRDIEAFVNGDPRKKN